MRIFIALIVVLASMTVHSAPLTWTLNGATYEDGSIIDGTFDYDADTNVYSNIALVSQEGSGPFEYTAFGGDFFEDYNFLNSPNVSDANTLQTVFQQGGANFFILNLDFASALTNAGGVVALNTATSNETADLLPSFTDSRMIVSGSVSAVPVPAAVWLLASALAGLGWIRRK